MGFVFEDLELNARRDNNWKNSRNKLDRSRKHANIQRKHSTQKINAKMNAKKSIYTTFNKIIIYCSSRLRAENGIH